MITMLRRARPPDSPRFVAIRRRGPIVSTNMATEKPKQQQNEEPRGLDDRNLGPTAEAAHEQGWQINQEQRTSQPSGKPAHYGGTDYNYGAQDLGDTPEDMSQLELPENQAEQPGISKPPQRPSK